jgi:hypothetical protein
MSLDYKYENIQYYNWIEAVSIHASTKYQAEVELLSEENSFIYSHDYNTIKVKGSTPPRDKLYILLHEIGHVSRLMESGGDSTFFLGKSGSANIRERTMTLMEEVLAWHRGEQIAKKLDIILEPRAWQRLMNKSINKYVEWINENREKA